MATSGTLTDSASARSGAGRPGKTTLPEKVAQLYYSLGLFCSSYPTTIITIAITVVLCCCYPLVNLPLPGNLPFQVPGPNNDTQTIGAVPGSNGGPHEVEPWCYIQQVVMRTAVIPWTSNLVLADAFRAPLYEVFKLLEIIRNYEHGTQTIAHLCLHVEAVKRTDALRQESLLPEYNCLILSPANFWQQDIQQFNQDPHLLTTIFNHQNIQKGKTSLAEILFGMNLKETGIKRYPLRVRQRILQYAVTLIFKQHNPQFITGLKNKLENLYPLHQTNISNGNASNGDANKIVYIYYPGVFNYYEFVPLAITFLILFFYIYFSVRKIELIKSKFGMAFAAVMTVVGSLFMSVGLCFFFGLTLSMQGKEIFPYLVILVGLENVLVLTKSVVSTPQHLDVKIRLAQGLSKEGWSITKNILVEITILTIGLATFVPVIQEFCIFAITGLISDFFLQMFFFTTILGIDIHRMEITAEKTHHTNFHNSLYQTHNLYERFVPTIRPSSSTGAGGGGMSRSKSHPRLTSASATTHTNVVANQTQTSHEKKIPKRLRLVNIWARTRFFQRAFMIWMVVWISIIVYNSGIIEHFLEVDDHASALRRNEFAKSSALINSSNSNKYQSFDDTAPNQRKSNLFDVNYVTTQKVPDLPSIDELAALRHPVPIVSWPRLSAQHWPAIFRKYNISLSGNHIAILPTIKISHTVSPEQATAIRNPDERYELNAFQWQALAAALDPIDFYETSNGGKTAHDSANDRSQIDQPFYPNSPMEIFLATILCAISVVVLAYTMVVLYRCVCTRNYAEWRTSWSNEKTDEPVAAQLVMEAVPMVLDGHQQEIECLVTDGSSVVSTCLGGQLKVWDAATGEQLANIDRKTYFGGIIKPKDLSVDYDDAMLSDYESGSPPSRDENSMSFPSLQKKINTNFSNLRLEQLNSNSNLSSSTPSSFDFGDHYRQLYLHHEPSINETMTIRNRNNNNNNTTNCGTSSTTTSTTATINTTKWIINQTSVNLRQNQHYYHPHHYHLPHHRHNHQIRNMSDERSHSVDDVNNSVCVSEVMQVPPIWCIDYMDNLIVLGCANGRLEFWEGTTGKLKCVFEDGNGVGITSLKLVGNRVIAAKLNGSIDFIQLQSFNHGREIDWGFTSAYRRTHVRTGSTGSIIECSNRSSEYGTTGTTSSNDEDLRCIRVQTTKAHQQPITVLDAEGGRVVSGSQDHTLKVYRLDDASALYTLHGHCGPITCMFIDRVSPMMSGSGSQDGLLCVWDLATGACMYSTQAHDGAVTSLTYSASYVISLGTDEKLCVWERFQGHLLNTIQVTHTYTSGVLMLTHNLLVTARNGSLIVLDVRTGDTARVVQLGHRDACVFVKQQLLLRDASIVCDYGNQLRIVRFPLITHKFE